MKSPIFVIVIVFIGKCISQHISDDKIRRLETILDETQEILLEIEKFRHRQTPWHELDADEIAIQIDPSYLDDVVRSLEFEGFRIVQKSMWLDDVYIARRVSKRRKRSSTFAQNDDKIIWYEALTPKVRDKRNVVFDDPLGSTLWRNGDRMRIHEAWQLGYSGKGVVVGIIDDGINFSHRDLKDQEHAESHRIFEQRLVEEVPAEESEIHGTLCAGVLGMLANNSFCGVGVAFDSHIADINLLSVQMNDALEADTFAFSAISNIHVFSSSWGPADDGNTVDGPGYLASQALRKAVTEGRNGLGAIHVWASGNGGLYKDDCALDGYASSRYTLAVGVATDSGDSPWFAEDCPSILTTVFSTGTDHRGMASTASDGSCSTSFSGSSAAAPIAAGIVAFLLETNPKLSWRDVQHIMVYGSDPSFLRERDSRNWSVNGAGLNIHRHFGFGGVDAMRMIELAKNWTTVPEQKTCRSKLKIPGEHGVFSPKNPFDFHFEFSSCEGSHSEVNHIENVELTVSIEHSRRGNVEVDLRSPSGTKVRLLRSRPEDVSSEGLINWTLSSNHQWGEDPRGTWRVQVIDNGESPSRGKVTSLSFAIHGTTTQPHSLKGPPAYYTRTNRIETSDINGAHRKLFAAFFVIFVIFSSY